ncbi:HAMP domain-containing sensor histidine kinase [Lacimicrobium sp. SS2-24]|uniref:sensor histidine kinase n=1 Tax=Lacimicrobium sp. SS2-24 TaxID=2005569 RepID=UPI000B4B829A|nr:HAMP domain-containing sensor histidine kinase [Lacimicrobium sp. SS2-24]
MYRRKLISFAAVSLGTAVIAAVAVIWSTRMTQNHIDQVNIANTLLSEHLLLSSTSYRLFKQLTDEILVGESANQALVRNKRAAISESLGKIRLLEESQRQALGVENTRGTVEDTDDLERLIDDVIADFELIASDDAARPDVEQIRFVLEERIDIAFREAINSAVERQSSVVRDMNNRIENVHRLIFWAALFLAVVAVLFAVLGCVNLIRAIKTPVDSLTDGAEQIAKGNLQHRVERGFDTEFDQIARAFNFMADKLTEQNSMREQNRQQLEKMVSERTAELTRANDALRNSAQVRKSFLADVSHELRTPLTIIRGEAQVALRKKDRDVAEYEDALSCILEQSVSLGRLVDDLLLIARAESDSLHIERQVFDINALLRESCRDVQRLADKQQIEVQCEQGEQPLMVAADVERIRQLMLILLENALRYSGGGAHVRVWAVTENEHLLVSVQDDGRGIEAQDLPYIFDRFYRGASTARGQNEQGLGLGLALAKAIVSAHGGEIRASSQAGQGTIMQFTLPG